jgi:hypothetical protein
VHSSVWTLKRLKQWALRYMYSITHKRVGKRKKPRPVEVSLCSKFKTFKTHLELLCLGAEGVSLPYSLLAGPHSEVQGDIPLGLGRAVRSPLWTDPPSIKPDPVKENSIKASCKLTAASHGPIRWSAPPTLHQHRQASCLPVLQG